MHDTGERDLRDAPATGKGAIVARSRVAEKGAKKYADRNWGKRASVRAADPIGAAAHDPVDAGAAREDHLAAVAWNVMAMMHFEETGQAEEWNFRSRERLKNHHLWGRPDN